MSVIEIAFVLAMLIAATFILWGWWERRHPERRRSKSPDMITEEWKAKRRERP